MVSIEELVEQVDIVEYISQFVELHKERGEYWGLSPFTNEVHASFSVNPEKNVFYDFSSGNGGSVFSFIQKYFNYNNYQVVQELARYCNVDVDTLASSKKLEINKICKKYSKGCRGKIKTVTPNKKLPWYCMDNYELNRERLKIWEAEGISEETMERFQVRYDDVGNRIVFPIRDIDGNIVNVSGRTLDPDFRRKELRKYTYYSKWGTMDIIYGLYENMEEIIEAREVILFEGAKSVMKCDTWGIKNTGAIMTSHLNEQQYKQLIRLGVRVVFALDADVDVRNDKYIRKLRNYCSVSYIHDFGSILDAKDSPVDKGREVFEYLYKNRIVM